MARDAVVKQARSRSGTIVSMATVSAGNITNGFKCDFTTTLEIWVTNSDASPRTLTVLSGVATSDGRVPPGRTATIPATSTVPVVVGTFLVDDRQPADGQLYFSLDALTGAKIAVVD